jgi:hypothetical protein
MTAWHFGLLIQAMVPLSGIALVSVLAEQTANDPRHVRPRA